MVGAVKVVRYPFAVQITPDGKTLFVAHEKEEGSNA
jgi:hypothetical protein